MNIMEMTIAQILGGGLGLLTVLLAFIEISPIKVSPLAWIGRRMNKELVDKVDKLDEKVADIDETVQKQNAITCRVRILRFGDEVTHGDKHSRESFDQVLADIDTYEQYCAEHPGFKNNKTVITTKTIKDNYAERIEKNDFL